MKDKVLIFTSYRDSVNVINEKLNEVGVRSEILIGKSGETGLKQKKQIETVQRFRDGETKVLVATRVGEEGLDIPSTDVVVFYEPVSSAIRLIQRRGRTGRNRPGEVFIFVTEGSRDEAALWSSRGKEQRMQDLFSAGRIEIDLPNSEELVLLKSSETLEIETGQTTFDVE